MTWDRVGIFDSFHGAEAFLDEHHNGTQRYKGGIPASGPKPGMGRIDAHQIIKTFPGSDDKPKTEVRITIWIAEVWKEMESVE